MGGKESNQTNKQTNSLSHTFISQVHYPLIYFYPLTPCTKYFFLTISYFYPSGSLSSYLLLSSHTLRKILFLTISYFYLSGSLSSYFLLSSHTLHKILFLTISYFYLSGSLSSYLLMNLRDKTEIEKKRFQGLRFIMNLRDKSMR